MQTAILVALVLSFSGPARSGRATATAGAGRSKTVVTARGRTLKVRVGSRNKSNNLEVKVGGQCPANVLSSVVARTVQKSPRAFKNRKGLKVTVNPLSTTAEVHAFEKTLGKILSNGKHRVQGKRGFTEIPGFVMRPGAGRAGRGQGRGGRDSGGGSFTVTPGRSGGSTIVREILGRGGVRDTTTLTFGSDGSSTMTRVLGLNGVEVTQTSEHDENGQQTGGFTSVHTNGGPLASASGGVQPTTPPKEDNGSDPPTAPGGGSESDESPPSPSEPDEGGDEEQETGDDVSSDESTAPDMSADGSYTAPPLRLDDAMLGQMINWNRLGGAITNPDPTADEDVEPSGEHSGNTLGPCGGLEDPDFVPDAKFLRPNKQGWVTDPVPSLYGSRNRGRNRER